MILALILFAVTYVLMLRLQQYRPWVALCSAVLFIVLGEAGVYEFSLRAALQAVDYNVLLMMAGTMGMVALFIESKMPARLAEMLIVRVPDVKWAVCMLALFAGVISAFVDNVATVLMVAPVGLAIARKLKISPVPVLIAIAVSSNLQGAATLVGDTTSILLGSFADMNFFDFFWMRGRPGIFWGVELGALATIPVIIHLFRKQRAKVVITANTEVEDYVPSVLLLLNIVLLIVASFLPGLPAARRMPAFPDILPVLLQTVRLWLAKYCYLIQPLQAADNYLKYAHPENQMLPEQTLPWADHTRCQIFAHPPVSD